MICLALICALFFGIAGPAQAAEPMSLGSGRAALYGTLELPSAVSKPPVALIISGSGPTDRDGNNRFSGDNNSLKLLARSLSRRGIASLRYDKRGVAASAAAIPGEVDLRFDTYIRDAQNWGKLLRQDSRLGPLFIIGHSEGALIGAVASQRLEAKGFISVCGAGSPAYEVLEAQLKSNLPPDLLAAADKIISRLKEGKTSADVPPPLLALFRPSVQPYLVSWFRYDPSVEIAKVEAPVLIIHGTTDIQLDIDNARQLALANPEARLVLIQRMNHVLKTVPNNLRQQRRSYADPSLPVNQELVDVIAAFIDKNGKN